MGQDKKPPFTCCSLYTITANGNSSVFLPVGEQEDQRSQSLPPMGNGQGLDSDVYIPKNFQKASRSNSSMDNHANQTSSTQISQNNTGCANIFAVMPCALRIVFCWSLWDESYPCGKWKRPEVRASSLPRCRVWLKAGLQGRMTSWPEACLHFAQLTELPELQSWTAL